MTQEILIQVDLADAGLRLDYFLAQRLPDYTRAQLCKYIKESRVLVNGHGAKPSYKLGGLEKVQLKILERKATGLKAQDLPLDIIFSDEHIAVINKAPGMVVHPGAGIQENTLVNALLYAFPHMSVGGQERPGIVHRLDKNTSGVMVVALTHAAHVALTDAFKNREVEKIYRVFSYGHIEPKAFELKTGHVRHPVHRLRFFTGIPAPLGPSKVRMAHTSFKVNFCNFGVCDISARLHTGRTHQIRAHLADINHPLVGDLIYAGVRELPREAPEILRHVIKGLLGQALHAETLSFAHPITQEKLSFSAPLPAHIISLVEAMQSKIKE